jgi:threonylcarbamoyladenosine tRNA methylthiotransferase MtaB
MVEIVSFGCRLNTLESEVIRARSAEAGLDDAVIVNSCAVTGEAVRQARQAVRKAKREAPDRRVIVTGCAAQIDPAAFADMAEVDLVLGNEEKLDHNSYRPEPDFGVSAEEKVKVDDIMAVRETAGHLVDGLDGRSRAFVQIQNGCDHRCTFCIIPYGRGNSRSVPMGAVVTQVRRLVATGHAELVLTGVDLTAYGADLPGRPTLGRLVQAILKEVPELQRLRLSSIDSVEVDDALLRAIAEEERLMPHFHLSLQSGDDLILKRMRRRHSRDQAIAFTQQVRALRPGVVFGADLIAGFPTESDAAFANSVDLVAECGLTYLHVFPFSPRPGTPAAHMPQLDRRAIRQRAAKLRARGADALAAHFASERGRMRKVLVERPGFGRTEHYTPAKLAGGQPGDVVSAHITGHDGDALLAEVA